MRWLTDSSQRVLHQLLTLLPVQVDHLPILLLLLLLLCLSRREILVSQPVFQVLLILLQVLADTLLSQMAIGGVMLVSLATNTVDMDRNIVIFVHTNKLERKGLSITNISLPGTRLR